MLGGYALSWFPAGEYYLYFSFALIAFFAVLAVVSYVVGGRLAGDKDRNSFTRFFLGFTMVKMFLVIAFVAIYFTKIAPGDQFFLVPLLGIYFVFVIFETIVFLRLSKIKPKGIEV